MGFVPVFFEAFWSMFATFDCVPYLFANFAHAGAKCIRLLSMKPFAQPPLSSSFLPTLFPQQQLQTLMLFCLSALHHVSSAMGPRQSSRTLPSQIPWTMTSISLTCIVSALSLR